MLRTFFDLLGKEFWLAAYGEEAVEVEAAVWAEAAPIDLLIRPVEALPPALEEALGVAAPMVRGPTCIELFSEAPSADEVVQSRSKHVVYRASLLPRPWPVLWIICAGRPDAVLEQGWAPMLEEPAGFYVLQEPEPVRILVVPELARTAETLFLRLMGKGRVLDEAIADLDALPPQAPLLNLATPILVAYRVDLVARGYITPDTSEAVMNLYQRGLKILEETRLEGREEELRNLFSRRLKRPLTEAELATFHARFEALGAARLGDVVLDTDAAGLEAWLGDPDAS